MVYTLDDLDGWSTSGHKFDYLYAICNGKRQAYINPNDKSYRWYGGKGRKMYKPWLEDLKLMGLYILNELGERPVDHSIDHIKCDGDCVPGNLKWSTVQQQRLNRIIPTNTGEPHISFGSNGYFKISHPGGCGRTYRRTMDEAITVRNQLWTK